jgi:hypothetical protein
MMSKTLYVKARELTGRLEGKSARSRLQVQDRITKLLNDNGLYTEAAIFEDMTTLMREMVIEDMNTGRERRLKGARK